MMAKFTIFLFMFATLVGCEKVGLIKSFDLADNLTLEVRADDHFERMTTIYVNLKNDNKIVHVPVFVGSLENPDKNSFEYIVTDETLALLWTNDEGKKLIVYLYSMDENFCWPLGFEGQVKDDINLRGGEILKSLNQKNQTNYSFGVVE